MEQTNEEITKRDGPEGKIKMLHNKNFKQPSCCDWRWIEGSKMGGGGGRERLTKTRKGGSINVRLK